MTISERLFATDQSSADLVTVEHITIECDEFRSTVLGMLSLEKCAVFAQQMQLRRWQLIRRIQLERQQHFLLEQACGIQNADQDTTLATAGALLKEMSEVKRMHSNGHEIGCQVDAAILAYANQRSVRSPE